MVDICNKCGLPKELCVCQTIAKEEEKIRISFEKRRYGKNITVIKGIDSAINMKDLLKNLKTMLACGGTIKEDTIELQGNHRKRIKEILIRLGFPENKIEIE